VLLVISGHDHDLEGAITAVRPCGPVDVQNLDLACLLASSRHRDHQAGLTARMTAGCMPDAASVVKVTSVSEKNRTSSRRSGLARSVMTISPYIDLFRCVQDGPQIDDCQARILKALADPTRLRLVSMVAAHEGGEACVCELTDRLGLTQPTISHHLKVLVDAGIFTRDKRGKWAYYALVPSALNALSAILSTGQ
jgi:ArsR family transcriptional regulator, arsenate/arsenite/antimonite-responsive transcriptional repressor